MNVTFLNIKGKMFISEKKLFEMTIFQKPPTSMFNKLAKI